MNVASLGVAELGRRLAGPGLRLRTGPVVNVIRSRLPTVRDGIALHYAQHSIEPDEGFADFHVELAPPLGARRFVRPQAYFIFEGLATFKPLALGQAFAMMEWGLNWCVSSNCHRYLMIHAAVIECGGRAAIFPAPPGSGKSTLCAGLVNRGWRLLSDELTLIEPGGAAIVPVPRPVSLKNASIDVIRHFAPDAAIGPVVHDTLKGSVAHMRPPADAVGRSGETARPGFVVFPRYAAEESARLVEVPKARAFMRLAENSFNYDLHGKAGFTTLARVVEESACYEFSYSSLDEAVAVFAHLAGSTS